jgi:putative glycosyltransferase (TIGR04348 family)
LFMNIVIVSPFLGDANNGNWRTARRWQQYLAALGSVRIVQNWPDERAEDDEVMIALHARRSAAAVDAWAHCRGQDGLAVVLTGTDLHRDIEFDSSAIASLRAARFLVVLHDLGIASLPAEFRGRARVILQSASAWRVLEKTSRRLNAIAVGHLRQEKSPETLFAAARLLNARADIRISHLGGVLDPDLGRAAETTMRAAPAYRWLGQQSHALTRRAIQRAHVLVHMSRMEGGANVIIESIRSGTPVLASAVDGNIGLLGADYPGYFPWGDAAALADALQRLRHSQGQSGGFLQQLQDAVLARSALFAPACERSAVRQLAEELAQSGSHDQRP